MAQGAILASRISLHASGLDDRVLARNHFNQSFDSAGAAFRRVHLLPGLINYQTIHCAGDCNIHSLVFSEKAEGVCCQEVDKDKVAFGRLRSIYRYDPDLVCIGKVFILHRVCLNDKIAGALSFMTTHHSNHSCKILFQELRDIIGHDHREEIIEARS